MGIKSRNKVSVSFSMSSMTDIVFLLLIFFIIVSTMVSPNALKVLLPTSSAKTSSPQTVSVTITPELGYYVNGNPVDVSALESMIKTKIGEAEKPGIVLHCDQTVAIEHAVKVMDIANKNQYDLVLATKPN
jgi:biopolymer transport protein ExbD